METRAKTKATTGLTAMFNNHIKNNPLGSLAIEKVTLDHIQIFYNSMRSKGLSPKTYNKTIKEILRPMFKYALIHRALAFEPTFGLKLDKIEKKSKVINCSDKLRNLFSAINELYADDVFYWTLFALIFTGRRKSEILNLKWKNINFGNNTMLLERTKNSNDYIVAIPNFIAAKLQEIPRVVELVFASPVSGETIVNLDRQVKKNQRTLRS
ncbi:tyrosine-type recombinase/integrase [Campylobacter concisus]|uniref:tyrosine-type recombinase/integrase n=1 Tax=Campylobacter concisus TaxID=199 RepID=UPI000D355F02|nr:site-specific integrase [Campylobacter concisus]